MSRYFKILTLMGTCFLCSWTIQAKKLITVRDPFQPMTSSPIQKNLSEYSINTVKLIGFIKDDEFNQHTQHSKNKIVIIDPDNHVYFLNLGDVICLEKARIKTILDSEVVLEWTFQNQSFADRLKITKED